MANMGDNCIDNCFEWYTGEKRVSVTFSQRKYVNKLKKYAEKYPDEIEIVKENQDGSIFAHIPISWVKFSPPRQGREFTDEERAEAAERMRKAREKKNGNKEL